MANLKNVRQVVENTIKRLQVEKKTKAGVRKCKKDSDCNKDGQDKYSCVDGQCIIAVKTSKGKKRKSKSNVKEQIGPGTPTQNVAGTGNLWQYNIDICFDWAANWTMNNAFLNPNANPNQPCNHICQRIDHWSNLNQPGISMVKASRLKCKITHGLQQSQIHSCNC